jgi:hypothetical protein
MMAARPPLTGRDSSQYSSSTAKENELRPTEDAVSAAEVIAEVIGDVPLTVRVRARGLGGSRLASGRGFHGRARANGDPTCGR